MAGWPWSRSFLLTQIRDPLGHPRSGAASIWKAPGQHVGPEKFNHPALGCLRLEMLTGTSTFRLRNGKQELPDARAGYDGPDTSGARLGSPVRQGAMPS